MEARAYARFQAEPAAHEAKLARRSEAAASGKPPRGRAPQAPAPAPQSQDQVNFTDPASRIMKTKDGFPQAYNAQAGGKTASRLIVGPRVSQGANDQPERLPNVPAVRGHVLFDTLLVDRSLVSASAAAAVELATPGLTVLAVLQREPQGRAVAQFEKRSDPPAPPPEAPFAERMRHRTASTAGRALAKLRPKTGEPVFGISQDVLGFRRCSLRGLAQVTLAGAWSASPTAAHASTASAPPSARPETARRRRPTPAFRSSPKKTFPRSLFSSVNFSPDPGF